MKRNYRIFLGIFLALITITFFTSCKSVQTYLDKYNEIDAQISKRINDYKLDPNFQNLHPYDKKELIREIRNLGRTFKAKDKWDESERIYFLQLLDEAEKEVRAKRKKEKKDLEGIQWKEL